MKFWKLKKNNDPHCTCIPEITDSQKRDYINVLKVSFQRSLRKGGWYTGPNIVEIWTTAPLLDSLITVKAIKFQKVSVSDIESFETVC